MPMTSPARKKEPLPPRTAFTVSVAVHAAIVGALVYVFWSPKPPARVQVFELVSLEAPKLRPLAPKEPDPPAAAPEEPAAPPEAPRLTSDPKTPAPAKPEPKKVRPVQDSSLPVRETPREAVSNSPVQVTNAPGNPRMNFWAGRVKAKIEQRWNPPLGIEVDLPAKTVMRFRVSLEGEISSVEVSQSSGSKLLDDEAKNAILRTATLPPPPVSESFSEDFLQVSYEFIYRGH
jgi:protein TonB